MENISYIAITQMRLKFNFIANPICFQHHLKPSRISPETVIFSNKSLLRPK